MGVITFCLLRVKLHGGNHYLFIEDEVTWGNHFLFTEDEVTGG